MMNLKDAEKIALEKDLHGTEYKVFFFILARINYENEAFVTQSFIANGLGMPQPQVSLAIKKLVASEIIRKTSKSGINGYAVSESFVTRGSLKQ